VLSGQQMSAQLYCHILVVYHLHPGNILFHPVGLELILLPEYFMYSHLPYSLHVVAMICCSEDEEYVDKDFF
jgi:hypothetical protein